MTIKTKFEVEGLQTIISQLKTFGTAGEDAAKQLKAAIDNVNTKKLEQDVESVAKSFDGLVTSVLNFKNILAATAIGTAATALFEFAKSGIEAAVSIERNAAAAGQSATQYQVLSEAMKRAGGSQEQLNTALRRFTTQVGTQGPEQLKTFTDAMKFIVEKSGGVSAIVFKTADDFAKLSAAAAQAAPLVKASFEALGDPRGAQSIEAIQAKILQLLQQFPELRKQFADIGITTPAQNIIEKLDQINAKAKGTFASLGISLVDVGNKIKTPEKAFLEFVDAVSKMGTVEEQASAIVKVFGRQAGPELAKLIREGTASLKELEEFLRSRGILFSPEQLAAAHEAEEQIKKFEGTLRSFRDQVSVALAPSFTHFFEELSKQFDEFIKAGGIQKVKDNILSLVGVAGSIKEAFDGVASDLNKAFSTDLSGTKLMLGLIALRALLVVVNPLLIALGVALAAAGKAPPPAELSTWDALLQNIGKDIDFVKNRIKELSGQPIAVTPVQSAQNLDAAMKDLSQAFQDSIVNMGAAKTASDKFADAALANAHKVEAAQKAQQGASITFLKAPAPGEDPFAKKAADTLAAAGAPVIKTETLVAPFVEADKQISEIWANLIQFIETSAGEINISGATKALVQPFTEASNQINTIIDQILQKVRELMQAIQDAASSASILPGGAPFGQGGIGAAAGGGLIRGPGTSTSDSILAWLSNQEFVVNARAVSHYGPELFAALNAMRLPRDFISSFNMGGLARALSGNRFASGGMVTAGSPVVLNIDRQSFNMMAGDDTITQLKRFAVTAQLSSSGRKPRWVR